MDKMLEHVGSDGRKMVLNSDSKRFQDRSVTNTAQLENLGGFDGPVMI